MVGFTIVIAFTIALSCGHFFNVEQLKANTDLISAVYQVMGTVYAILLTFTLWGVWQNYTEADASVQKEAFALLDLVHIIEASSEWKQFRIREAALNYSEGVVSAEWASLKNITSKTININEENRSSSIKLVEAVHSIKPTDALGLALFSQALNMLNNWLDARRTRILIARGNSACSLWPLLLIGAMVLFAFHGLFVAETVGIWATLLAGTALVIGLTFYLIFTLDCPFAGSPSIDSEPFNLAINVLKHEMTA